MLSTTEPANAWLNPPFRGLRNLKRIRPGLLDQPHTSVCWPAQQHSPWSKNRGIGQSTPHHVLPLHTPANPALAIILQQVQGPHSNSPTSPVPYLLSSDSAQHLSELQLKGEVEPCTATGSSSPSFKMAAGAETSFQMAEDSQCPLGLKIEGHPPVPCRTTANRGQAMIQFQNSGPCGLAFLCANPGTFKQGLRPQEP